MLPITRFIPQVKDSLSKFSNLVLQAEPGAGKSTELPLSLLDSDWLNGKKILMLEPRRVAARSIAYYLAKRLDEAVGQRIGYQVKNEKRASKETILEIVTEGILTRKLQNDPEITDYGLIIFDEFHERSIHADLGLMLALEVQQTIREDLKLLVMSATIDTTKIAAYMQHADVIECPGKTYPVSLSYIGSHNDLLTKQVLDAIRSALRSDTAGDILIFLPGRGEILKCLDRAKEVFSECICLPLYGALPMEQQELALRPDPKGRRRIIFSTNIAETSLTIEGVTCVIDSGLEKELEYDPNSDMTRLKTQSISQASAEQRKGRAGRIQAGECIRLWSKEKQRCLKTYQTEEILKADLSNTILELYKWGAGTFEDINWLTPPPKSHFDSALNTLMTLGLTNSNGKLTKLGHKAANIALPPRLSAMLYLANGDLQQGIACELAALLSERDIFHSTRSVDIIDRLLAVQEFKADRKSALRAYPLLRTATEQLLINARNYRKTLQLKENNTIFSLGELQSTVGPLLLHAYHDRVAKKRPNSYERYQLANGRGAVISSEDSLVGSEWLIVVDSNAQNKDGFINSATNISEESISSCLSDKIETKNCFDIHGEKISAKRVSTYGALEISTVPITDIPPSIFQDCIKEYIISNGLKALNWTSKCEDLVARASWLSKHLDKFPLRNKEQLPKNIDEWLLPYLSSINSLKQLKSFNIYDLILANFSWDEQQLLESEAPTVYQTPSKKSIPIIYDSQQGPTVSVQLQEMFGQLDSPMIGGGKVPIRFELLSPARRPIQTTSDLKNFWSNSYFDVAKDMRGRYPKHRWPEQPLLEKPGRSIKTPKCQR